MFVSSGPRWHEIDTNTQTPKNDSPEMYVKILGLSVFNMSHVMYMYNQVALEDHTTVLE